MATAREVKIKTGVLKRSLKDNLSYEKEEQQLIEKIEKMKSDGADEYDIRKQVWRQVCEER
jgi:tubulin-specific chaperone A